MDDQSHQWSAFRVGLAGNYWRCVVFGRVFAMCIFVFAKVAMDAILSSWREAILGGVITRVALGLCLALLVLAIPIAKARVFFQTRRLTVTRLVQRSTDKLKKTLGRPLIYAIFMMSTYLLIFMLDDLIRELWASNHTWPTVRTLSLLAFPLVLPIAYFVVRETTRRAESWLEKISKDSG